MSFIGTRTEIVNSWRESGVPAEIIELGRGTPCPPSRVNDTTVPLAHPFPPNTHGYWRHIRLERHHCSVRLHVLVPQADESQWCIIVSNRVNDHQRLQLEAVPRDVPPIVGEGFEKDELVRPID